MTSSVGTRGPTGFVPKRDWAKSLLRDEREEGGGLTDDDDDDDDDVDVDKPTGEDLPRRSDDPCCGGWLPIGEIGGGGVGAAEEEEEEEDVFGGESEADAEPALPPTFFFARVGRGEHDEGVDGCGRRR